jgi:putative heme-binding domain-containing protein
MIVRASVLLFVGFLEIFLVQTTRAQSPPAPAANDLESKLREQPVTRLAERVETLGRAEAGAVLFHTSAAACVKCHADVGDASPLGPTISELGEDTKTTHVIEAILHPSKSIRKGYETWKVLTVDGSVRTGIRVDQKGNHVVLRDATNLESSIRIAETDIEAMRVAETSLMPEGLASALRDEQAFYDLTKYVVEVARGGPEQARALKPAASELTVTDDTQNLDHAGILADLGADDFEVGKSIYFGHCVNCHGPDGNTPKLATARAFGTQRLKFGADPLSMLRTLTLGNGLMAGVRYLSPKERYQVIHFIREAFMKGSNPDYREIDEAYLASLPKGTNSGEFKIEGDRDFGPVLASQLGQQVNSGLTFRLPHDVSVTYDLHRFRLGGAWSGGFLDLSQTQHFRQRGERMPKPMGTPLSGLDAYAWQLGDSFTIPEDAKPPRGPVREDLASYHGHYLHGDRAVLSYAIHGREVLETITAAQLGDAPIIRHSLHIAASKQPLALRVIKQTRQGQPEVIAANAGSQVDAESSIEASLAIPIVPASMPKAYADDVHRNQAWHEESKSRSKQLDLGTPGRTLLVRFRTRKDGTLVASAPDEGDWKPNGKTLFIRGGRLVYDIGWVGAIQGKRRVDDGRWHTAALVVTDQQTRLFIDGTLAASRDQFRRPAEDDHVLKVGATATNFAGDFGGEIQWATIVDSALDADRLAETIKSPPSQHLWQWQPDEEPANDSTEPIKRAPLFTAACVSGDTEGVTWEFVGDGEAVLKIPSSDKPRLIELNRTVLPQDQLARLQRYASLRRGEPVENPEAMTAGGPARWPQLLKTTGTLGQPVNGYAFDSIEIPFENPWNAWMRTSALDFFPDGRCVVTTHGGDVYLVDGLDDSLGRVTWKRFAAGLFEPFGVRVVDGMIYVTCRDGIKRLHDHDGNNEADFVEAFWIDDDLSSMFHAYNFDLQTDSKGNFYFAKAGQYTRHHRPGTIMKIPPEGGRAEVVAWGLRTPNGMGKLPGDRFTVSDNQGPWMPAGKISLIKPGGFYGNMPINDEQDAWLRARHDGELPETFDEPFIWMPQELDNSCGGQVWVDDQRFGPLSGRLLHSSFGKGWLYYLSLQDVGDVTQGSIIALPHQWEAGVMRLRVGPHDGQVYGTGLSGWQGPKRGSDGCLQRLRYTGGDARIVDQTEVTAEGVKLHFNFPVSDAATDTDHYNVQMWDYRWTRNYGSDQYSVLRRGEKGRDALDVERVRLSEDHMTATLEIPDLRVCDQLLIKIDVSDQQGEPVRKDVYFTVHAIP